MFVMNTNNLPLMHPADASERGLIPTSVVAKRLGVSRSTVHRRIGTDRFPAPVARLWVPAPKGRPTLLFPATQVNQLAAARG